MDFSDRRSTNCPVWPSIGSTGSGELLRQQKVTKKFEQKVTKVTKKIRNDFSDRRSTNCHVWPSLGSTGSRVYGHGLNGMNLLRFCEVISRCLSKPPPQRRRLPNHVTRSPT
jgi:hypothetical protein